MAHFAELDLNNKVLRVVVACNQDIANNGGEQSEQAAEHFKTITPFSSNGVKWVQTSYNSNFRKQFAGIGYTYDVEKNMFVTPQPFNSWILDNNGDWKAPVEKPILTEEQISKYMDYYWDENSKTWIFFNPQ